jgi:hypothetical protein
MPDSVFSTANVEVVAGNGSCVGVVVIGGSGMEVSTVVQLIKIAVTKATIKHLPSIFSPFYGLFVHNDQTEAYLAICFRTQAYIIEFEKNLFIQIPVLSMCKSHLSL